MNHEKARQITRAIKALALKDPRFHINEIRIIVALERAIARIERHQELAEHLVFKGGFVLLKIFESQRFTRDADALAISFSKEKLKDLIYQALIVDLDDGMWFGDIQLLDLQEQGQYGSYRFDCVFQIGEPDLKKLHKLSRIHIDIGFSDRLLLRPAEQIMPSLLQYENPVSWKIYPMEYIVAEKLETLYDRGSASSRAKDIYDLVYLIPRCQDKKKMVEAIQQTFKNRNTSIPTSLAKQAEEFDKTILKAAWPGVEILDDKTDFDDVWEMLWYAPLRLEQRVNELRVGLARP